MRDVGRAQHCLCTTCPARRPRASTAKEREEDGPTDNLCFERAVLTRNTYWDLRGGGKIWGPDTHVSKRLSARQTEFTAEVGSLTHPPTQRPSNPPPPPSTPRPVGPT